MYTDIKDEFLLLVVSIFPSFQSYRGLAARTTSIAEWGTMDLTHNAKKIKRVCRRDLPLYVGWKVTTPLFVEILRND